jgi:D-alanyl-D-alanine-carboxypeptidase/D-alanyl-D-alanine-endopeptidase
LCLLTFTAACAQTVPGPSLPELQSAGALGEDVFLQSGSTGMVLVVVRDNQVFFRGYGETAPGSHQVPTQGSLLRLCSLTKIFTTDVLARLVADGTVRLDDPLQHFAPPHILVPRRGHPVTLQELATHTSGLPREIGSGPRGTPHFTFPDYTTRWRWLPKQHLRSAPGKPYRALLAERLNALHMRNTTFFPMRGSAVCCSRQHSMRGLARSPSPPTEAPACTRLRAI